MEGRATLTIVTSIPTISRLMQQIHRISHGLRTFVDIYLLYVYKQIVASVAAAQRPALTAAERGSGGDRQRAVPVGGAPQPAVLAEQREQAAAAVQGLGGRGEAGPGEHGGLDAVERRLADLERERGRALGGGQAGGLRRADADRGPQLRPG